MLGVSAKTVTRWCESGQLPAKPQRYGKKTSYQISEQAVAFFQASRQQKIEAKAKPAKTVAHADKLPAWESAMKKGLIGGRAFSQATVSDYLLYARQYFQRHSQLTVKGLQIELARIPAERVSTREHFYKMAVCLGKFLLARIFHAKVG
jgi:hypothetical protein